MTTLRKTSMAVSALIVLGMGLIATNAEANLIDAAHGAGAGSFELGSFISGGGVLPFPGPDYMGVATGDGSTITGWTVGGAQGIDWLIEPRFRADTGVHSIDLQHITASSIATVIPTQPGMAYRLSFAAAAIPDHDNIGLVTAGSLDDEQFVVPYSASTEFSTQTFSPFSFHFTATDSSTTVTFRGTDVSGASYQYGPVIDSVSVVAVDDTDADGISDDADNCTAVANVDQRDTNGDDLGNACDADLNDDCSVNFGDLAELKSAFFPRPYNADADFDGDGAVNFGDLAFMKSTFFNGANPGPGPGAPGNACE